MEEEHKHEHHEHHSVHHPHEKGLKIKKNDILKSVIAVLAILLIASILTKGFRFGGGEGVALSKDDAAKKAVDYINTNILAQQGATAKLESVEEKNNLYNIKMDINGQKFDSYITKDGNVLFPSSVDMTAKPQEVEQTAEPPAQIEKSDKPDVELFVMSHCPFGTQAEKGIIPAIKLLGDKIDFKLRFVNYAMHGEKEVKEQANQYCIQKEQSEKLLDYLECFLKEGKGEECLKEVKIDVDKMKACVEKADKEFEISTNLNNQSRWASGRFPKFNVDESLNAKYGVQGSPTLIINGAESNAGRSSKSYLSGICAAFNTPPEECKEELSSANPSSGFGYSTESASTESAQCG